MSIKLTNVSHTYGVGTPFEKTALHDTNVEIHEGEFIGIIGHTGSGKSTLVQILNGLIKPTNGSVTVDGTDIGKNTKEALAVRHKVGMVFQYPEYQLFEETIARDIAFGPRNFGSVRPKSRIGSRKPWILSALTMIPMPTARPFG